MALLAAKNSLPDMNDTWGIIAGYIIDEYEVDSLVSNPELLKFADKQIVQNRLGSIYHRACDDKHVETMMLIIREYGLPYAEYFYFNKACEYGQLEVAQLMLTKHNIQIRERFCIFEDACEGGHLLVVKWLATRFQLTNEDIITSEALNVGQKHVVEWLASEYKLVRW